jgi:hypothetical protein
MTGFFHDLRHGWRSLRKTPAFTGALGRRISLAGMRAAAIGVGIGLVSGEFGSRLIKNLLFGVPAGDPSTFAAVAIVLPAVALCGGLIPADHAAGMNPVAALQEE